MSNPFACPKCGVTSWGGMDYCPECGTPWTVVCNDCKASWRYYFGYVVCPSCGSRNLSDITMAKSSKE